MTDAWLCLQIITDMTNYSHAHTHTHTHTERERERDAGSFEPMTQFDHIGRVATGRPISTCIFCRYQWIELLHNDPVQLTRNGPQGYDVVHQTQYDTAQR